MILMVVFLTACTNEQWNRIDEESKNFEFPSWSGEEEDDKD